MVSSATQQKVYDTQDRILRALPPRRSFPFVLSGGTALSRFYFHHRFSEDLDFFNEEEGLSFEKVEGVILHLKKQGFYCEMIGRADQPGRLKFAGYVVSAEIPIKMDFLEDPLSGIWLPSKRRSESGVTFVVDALDQIYYRKFYSILEQRHRVGGVFRIKDLLDIYFLHKKHRSIEKTLSMYLKEHISMDEEKIIMILGSIREQDIKKDLNLLYEPVEASEIIETLNEFSNRLLKKGLGQ